MKSFLLLFLLVSVSVRAIRAQDYDERASNQWWSDYASLDEYDDDDLDRHMNLIITKNILPGDAPLPFDEAQFYRRPPTSSEEVEFDFAPPPVTLPRRKTTHNRKNLIVGSTRLPPTPPPPPPPHTQPPPPPPQQTFRPSPKPIFRPALTRPSTRLLPTRPPPTRPTLPPPPPPPIDDDFLDEVVVEAEERAPPPFVRPELFAPPLVHQPAAILSDSQNVFVTQSPRDGTGDNANNDRFPHRSTFVPSSPSLSLSLSPSRNRQSRPDFADEEAPPPNSVVFVPPESFTSRPSPITRQSIAPNDFFSSPSTSSFSAPFESSQTPQGRRTQVLKRRFRPSTELPVAVEHQLEPESELPPPPPPARSPPLSPSPSPSLSPPIGQFRSERRRVRINSDSNSFSTLPAASHLENVPKKKKRPTANFNERSRLSSSAPLESSSFPVVASTVGRLLEPQRIATTFRPPTTFVVKKEVIRKKVPASSSAFPSDNTVSPFAVRRRPVIGTTPPIFSLPPSPSPDAEVRGRVRVAATTSIPQLFLSTQSPNSVHRHTPIDAGDISSNTEIISPADLRQVARQQVQREHADFGAQHRRFRRSSKLIETN